MQQEHYKKTLEGQDIIRGIWHDMKNHLTVIYSYIDSKEFKAAKENIRSIQKDLEYSMKEYISGNTVIDAILGEKKGVAKSKEIVILPEIIVPKDLSIDPMDFCTILGNGLDNAIEACERINGKGIEKRIDIKIKYEKHNLIIYITNPINEQTVKIKNGRCITSKKKSDRNEHGYGIYNIERAVKKYSGNLVIDVEKSRFTLNIVIPIIKK